jgi:hypothetical protein
MASLYLHVLRLAVLTIPSTHAFLHHEKNLICPLFPNASLSPFTHRQAVVGSNGNRALVMVIPSTLNTPQPSTFIFFFLLFLASSFFWKSLQLPILESLVFSQS